MVEVIWSDKIKPVNKAEIEKHLTPFLWLVPAWCNRLHIHLPDSGGENGEAIAQTQTDFAYRFIRLEIFTCWLNCSDSDKTFFLVHELVHGFVNTAYHQARRSIAALAGDDKEELKAFALHELSATNEAAVCDLTKVIFDKFRESPPSLNGHGTAVSKSIQVSR
jgi:hypothetical protein